MNVTLSTVHYHSKGNPCQGLPGCCARDEGLMKGKGRGLEGVLGEIAWGLLL